MYQRLEPTIPGSDAHPTIELLGVRLHAVTERGCIDHLLDEMEKGRGGVVVTPNLDHLRRARSDVNFGAMLAEADLVVADGMPLVWASRLQGTPLPERVAGSNLISTLSAAAASRGRSVFLLGGSAGTADGAARVLRERYPNLKIAGSYFPPVGFEDNPREMAGIIAAVSGAKPDIVYVALGSPKQERLIAKLRPILPGAWWLGVGNSFSFLCGDVRRAPLWMQKIGLEWVHRLIQEPRRLFRRYIVVGVPFAGALLVRCGARGIPNRLRRRRNGLASAGNTVRVSAQGAASIQPAGSDQSASELEPGGLQSASASRAAVASDTSAGLSGAPASAASATLADLTPLEARAPARGLRPESPLGIPSTLEAQLARTAWPGSSAESGRLDDKSLSRLRALVLLGGAVRTNALSSCTGRSVLDLPLDASTSILNFWLAQAADVARLAGLEQLPVRVMVNQNSPEPRSADSRFLGAWRVERDLSEYRGTGGVLRDIAKDYQDEDLILVANAAQILLDPLPVIVNALERKRGDVSVISHEDGTPSGIQLVACKTLRLLAATGFVDMKEQGLPLIAGKFDVRVVKRRRPTGLPVRSLDGYIHALHYYHRRRCGKPTITDPLAEDWSPAFSLIESGATVDPQARIHDSVVLAGGTVESGAVLVRSLVCPGATVRRDRNAVDQILAKEKPPRRARRLAASAT